MASNDTRDQGLTWRTAMKRCLPVALGGIAIYLVLPRITAVFGAWPRLSTLNPIWYAVAFGSEAVSYTCTIALQRLVLRTASWFTLVTAQLSGNAITNTMPGADALGAAVQFRMLARSGVDTDSTVSGLGVLSLLQVGSLFALPLFALPAILLGTPVKRGLLESALIGIAGFVLFAGGSLLFFRADRPLRLLGRAVQRVWNTISRRKPPMSGLDERLLHDRDAGKQLLGRSWRRAIVLTTGRLGFDFGCLLCVLRATHSSPSPSLVLLAYAAAGVIGLLPITPGGLGIVEASLSGFLILAGIPAGDAFLAVLAYRIISYWVPTFAGPFAYLAFRHRYRSARPPPPAVDT